MNKKRFTLLAVLIFILSIFLPVLAGCSSYYDDKLDKNNSTGVKMGGSDSLSLVKHNDDITIENAKIRAVFDNTGAIIEIANKQNGLYLVKNAQDALAVRVEMKDGFILPTSCSINIAEDTASLKKLKFLWQFENGLSVTACASLAEDADEVVFSGISLLGNKQQNTAISVEYPIVEQIDTLHQKETDYFVCPYATGYLFNNPTVNFNDGFFGITKDLGWYPRGWGLTMQFSAYYSKGIGGFYWQTKEDGSTIRSFTFVGDGTDKLRMSIYHYLSDIRDGDTLFNYDFVIANLTEGSWYTAANKYREWGTQQSWATARGVTSERNDYSKALYEETALCLFGYRAETAWPEYSTVYDMMKGSITGKIFNISIYNPQNYISLVKEYEDLLAIFEFNSMTPVSTATDEIVEGTIMSTDGSKDIFYGNVPYYFQCPYNTYWREQQTKTDKNFVATYDVDAYYYDVSVAACHPLLCYDTSHDHGTKVNVYDEYLNQYNASKQLSASFAFNTTGTEMFVEQFLPYMDYYQARANGGLLSWMEHDNIRRVLENNSATIIPLFDYVYHQYGALRLDGYLIPDAKLGQSYYSVAAYTVLNGGIPEYNYEYYYSNELPNTSEIDIQMMDYIQKLFELRSGVGKPYLIYGQMMPAPDVGSTQSTYEFLNPNYTKGTCCGKTTLSGEALIDDIITSAFASGDYVGLFFANTSTETKDVSFKLKAGRDYGITEGIVYRNDNGQRVKVGTVKNGIAKLDFPIEPTELVMLEVQKTK